MYDERINIRDYSLIGVEAPMAIEKGLADAEWYQTPIPREKMRELLIRKDWPAIRDSIIWFGLLFGSGYLVYHWWGSWLAILPYIVYSVIFASSSDSRWHESSHGTAFKTDWMNNLLYEISSFMVFRQSTVWRWSHARHHSDTIIRGRDPEIAVPRPPDVSKIIQSFFGLSGGIPEMKRMVLHASGKIDPQVATYLPESEYKTVIFKARVYLFIFLAVITASIIVKTILALMFIGLPTLLGTWLMPIYGLTQHAGLQENVLDHRLNCRTVYMNRINRFLYWNMNYHVEHHMFPLVPYHALPKLHELMKDDCPAPYKSIVAAFREIIPTIRKQVKNPGYFVERKLPERAGVVKVAKADKTPVKEVNVRKDKIEVCSIADLPKGEVMRFDFEQKTYALYRTVSNNYYATDGICTHGNAHLASGVVIDEMIECSKHNGRFDLKDGSPKRMPVCVGVRTYNVEILAEKLVLELDEIRSKTESERALTFKVVSNKNVATYIKELVLEPITKKLNYLPGQYMHLSIPPHNTRFSDFEIEEPFRSEWEAERLFDSWAESKIHAKRNYSMATNPSIDSNLKFNVRIALSPDKQSITAGTGSGYVFSLKAGDEVNLTGSYGDFLIKDTDKEMIYLGGGAGMAPIRSHISRLFETQKTKRKVSFWYGGRSEQELFYNDYFEKIQRENHNFSFHVALSEPKAGDNPDFKTGFITNAVHEDYLKNHKNPKSIEYYLCGPPALIQSGLRLFKEMDIPDEQISFDEF